MPLHSGVAAVILAAGKSSRFGGPKQLAVLGRRTLLDRTLEVVRRSDIEKIILVLGHEADKILKRINSDRAQVVINKEYGTGLSSSLKTGLETAALLDPGIDAVLIVLADQPFLDASTINRIIRAHRRSGRRIVVPVHQDVQGNPVLFHRSLFDELSKLSGDTGAKQVIQKHPDDVLRIEMDGARYLSDIDTREDLERALRRKSAIRTRQRNRVSGARRQAPPR